MEHDGAIVLAIIYQLHKPLTLRWSRHAAACRHRGYHGMSGGRERRIIACIISVTCVAVHFILFLLVILEYSWLEDSRLIFLPRMKKIKSF